MSDPPAEVSAKSGSEPDLPQIQRVAAYAVIVREDAILLSRLAPRVVNSELWTLPGGGVDHGEHPREAVVREVWEETGQVVEITDTARVYSGHLYGIWREGRRVDAHAVRVVYTGWVRQGSDPPRVVEENGSTCAAAWVPIADVLAGIVPVVAMVRDALADVHPSLLQRIAAYALIRRDNAVLLTRLSPIAPNAGEWTLPGGGLEHGESPAHAAAREVAEECGVECQIGRLVGVHDVHFTGTAPNGRTQDYHGIHIVYDATIDPAVEPLVAEVDGTTDAVAWVPVADVEGGAVAVLDVVRWALSHRR